MKGVGRIYQQTFVDTYSKVAFCKLYKQKTALTAADLLNDKVLPFFHGHGVNISRILTDRGTEYCGKVEHHEYQLYLAVNDIDHTRTKVRHPQTNGICERFHRTILDNFYRVAFRKKIYVGIEELQKDLDEWLLEYNNKRTHQGKMCNGRTPMQTFTDGKEVYREKQIVMTKSGHEVKKSFEKEVVNDGEAARRVENHLQSMDQKILDEMFVLG